MPTCCGWPDCSGTCRAGWATTRPATPTSLGYPTEIQDLLAAAEGLPDPLFGRVDALRTADGIAVVEFNATSETGGLEWVDQAGAGWWAEPATADALDRAGLRRVSPIENLAAEPALLRPSYDGGGDTADRDRRRTGGPRRARPRLVPAARPNHRRRSPRRGDRRPRAGGRRGRRAARG
ncbi:hypothetical protein G5V59_17125 [Nocardioides sp. W3-2-3]|uniref:hypothetical protein n=1 Tax=Nocardioides convexus TaxID=2712224 RepID=UPI002418B0DB|nr:hypothetical protein [Nocardioides convexus]NHA01019.1 hypothetical protein [Nocardioides convexus]